MKPWKCWCSSSKWLYLPKVRMPQHQHYWKKKWTLMQLKNLYFQSSIWGILWCCCWTFSQSSWTMYQIWEEIHSVYGIYWSCRPSTVSPKSDTIWPYLNHRRDQHTTLGHILKLWAASLGFSPPENALVAQMQIALPCASVPVYYRSQLSSKMLW